MNVTVLCSDPNHPVVPYLKKLPNILGQQHVVQLVHQKEDVKGGDVLFLVSCSELIREHERSRYTACLVLHASDLPNGRGWSPHIWEISQGAAFFTLSLIEAVDQLDAGPIWKKVQVQIPKHALWDEINALLFQAELDLIEYAVQHFKTIQPVEQTNTEGATYYSRRTPQHSKIDPIKSLAEQFDLIRVCDPNRFPAFFEYQGFKYSLRLEKIDEL